VKTSVRRLARVGVLSARRLSPLAWALTAAIFLASHGTATAHSASDAYLNLTADTASPAGKALIHGQWDIALRDLDFVLKLDDNGDGRITWGEVRRHSTAIETFAYQYLKVDGGPNNDCALKPRKQMIDDHADGAYAALFFDVICTTLPKKLTVRYSLFFAIDPSHRGIFVLNTGGNVATALLAPDNAQIDLIL
jgi:hypothetical protein